MLEPKAKNEMISPEVLAKKEAAATWCSRASTYTNTNGDKPWKYVLLPHSMVDQTMTLTGLASQFAEK